MVHSILLFIMLLLPGQTDSLPNKKFQRIDKPVIAVKPQEITFDTTEGKFYQAEVKILNRGVGTLVISRVESSCKCGSSTIMNSTVEPMTIGIIRLAVNYEGLFGDQNVVEFIVHSNASNSPTSVKVRINKSKLDSLKNK